MATNKIQLDPQDFALALLNNAQIKGEDDLRLSKNGLRLYLTAYLLANDFNALEAQHFNQLTAEELDRLFSRLKAFDFNQIS